MSNTYDEILTSMQSKFKELSGFEADDASDIGIRLKVLAGELFAIGINIDWIKNQMFAQTASDEQLDLHAIQRGINRKAASKSRGTLVFSRPSVSTYNITIPKGTICSTAGSDSVRVVTLSEVVLAAGSMSISVPAESESGGANTNLSTGSVTVMVTPPAGITAVTSSTAFTGGSDKESDEELRTRILYSYKNISNGTNCAFYRDCALSFDGVHSVSVVPVSGTNSTVDIYVAAKGGTVSSTLISEIQAYIDELREINVDAEVKSPTTTSVAVTGSITVKSGYQSADVIEACKTSIQEYFDTLSIGEKVKKAAVYNAIFNTPGVDNYSLTLPGSDVIIGATVLAIKGTVTLTAS